MNDFLGWRTSTKVAQTYVDSIKSILSSDSNFNNFRGNNSGYTPILEHLTKNDGLVYGNYIKNNYPEMMDILELLKKNDTVGSPLKYHYDGFGDINPTTLRYIKFAGDIKKRFGDISGYNLIEIGGGYGGLVRVLTELYDFKTIKMFDLEQPLKLQEKYLNKFGIEIETLTHKDDFNVNEKTIVISNYAWCECDRPTRDIYVNKIISKCDLTYMVVYGVDVENELMVLDGEKTTEHDTLNNCIVYTNKNK